MEGGEVEFMNHPATPGRIKVREVAGGCAELASRVADKLEEQGGVSPPV
jgi:hypothetical protein